MSDRAHILTDKEINGVEEKFHLWPNSPVVLSRDLEEKIELTTFESFNSCFRKKQKGSK